MMANAPTSTSGASSAFESMTARGSIMIESGVARCCTARHLRRHHHLGRGRFLSLHFRYRRKLPDSLERPHQLCFQDQLVAGLDGLAKARLVDAHEKEARLLVREDARGAKREDPGSMSECFDDHHTGHDRSVRKVPGEERLIEGHILDGADGLSRGAFEYTIHQQERITMRQLLEHRIDVHVGRLSHPLSHSHPLLYSGFRRPAA